MGMFDSLYDRRGNEWQTKAYGCALDRYQIGDELPGPFDTYQVAIFGGSDDASKFRDAYATVRHGILTSLPAKRDEHLPLLPYNGGPLMGRFPPTSEDTCESCGRIKNCVGRCSKCS